MKIGARKILRIRLKCSSIEKKSSNIDLLTKADIESEKLIISKIKEKYPNHSIISEESKTYLKDSKYTWIIDPLDGTTNFAHNLPIFAVSIALMKEDNIIMGVVYNPAADKCFYAELMMTNISYESWPKSDSVYLLFMFSGMFTYSGLFYCQDWSLYPDIVHYCHQLLTFPKLENYTAAGSVLSL